MTAHVQTGNWLSASVSYLEGDDVSALCSAGWVSSCAGFPADTQHNATQDELLQKINEEQNKQIWAH